MKLEASFVKIPALIDPFELFVGCCCRGILGSAALRVDRCRSEKARVRCHTMAVSSVLALGLQVLGMGLEISSSGLEVQGTWLLKRDLTINPQPVDFLCRGSLQQQPPAHDKHPERKTRSNSCYSQVSAAAPKKYLMHSLRKP